jgi:hypothetical protein
MCKNITLTRRPNVADWHGELESFFQEKEQKQKDAVQKLANSHGEVSSFFDNVVVPAFEELKSELEKYGREVKIIVMNESALISIRHKGDTELDYTLAVRIGTRGASPYPETRFLRLDGKTYCAQGRLREGLQDYTIESITKQEIIRHVLVEYKNHAKG